MRSRGSIAILRIFEALEIQVVAEMLEMDKRSVWFESRDAKVIDRRGLGLVVGRNDGPACGGGKIARDKKRATRVKKANTGCKVDRRPMASWRPEMK